MKLSIRNKLSLSLVACVSIPVLIICIALGITISNSARDTHITDTMAQLDQIDLTISNYINEGKRNAQMLARSEAVIQAAGHITVYKNNTRTVLPNPEEYGPRERAAFDLMSTMKASHPDYDCVYMGDQAGGYVGVPTFELEGGFDTSKRPWHRKALANPGKAILTEAYHSATGIPAAAIAIAIQDKNSTTGVMGLDLSLEALTDIVDDIKLGETGYVMLVEDDGTILSDPRHPENNFKEIDELASEGYRTLAKRTDGTVTVELDGKPQLASIVVSPKLGWKLIAVIEEGEVLHQARTMTLSALLIGAVTLVIFLVIAHFLSRSIAVPIITTTDMLEEIAQGEGDLTRRLEVNSTDEVGDLARWFNQFVEKLDNIMQEVKASAALTETATREVAAGGQGLSQITQEQASAVEEIAATIEEMSSSIKLNADHAANSLTQTRDMARVADESNEGMDQVVEAMTLISEASGRIGAIIETVDQVAFQTNLLALNAAVEAARAGEHGKGFAVVAEEVRTLAQRTADSSREIKTLIQEAVGRINAGDKLVKQTGESLHTMIGRMDQLSQAMEEINAASTEQAQGVTELNRAISQIDSATQQVASTVEELTGTAENLESGAHELADTVSGFKVSGEKAARPATGPRSATTPRPAAPQPPVNRALADEGFEEF